MRKPAIYFAGFFCQIPNIAGVLIKRVIHL
jgi:hypothetical protein